MLPSMIVCQCVPCRDDATCAPCHAAVGAKQGAPQITYEDAAFYLRGSTTGLKYKHTTVRSERPAVISVR
jgi:hypothetical protein